jgi:FkbM family methyltransferase
MVDLDVGGAEMVPVAPVRDGAPTHGGSEHRSNLADVSEADVVLEPMVDDALAPELRRRVDITLRCRDTDPLPKVGAAGSIQTDDSGLAYQVMHNGIRIVQGSYYGQWMTEIIRGLRGHHEPQEERAFAQVLPHVPAGSTMLELGSFWAYYSLWFLHEVRGGHAHLVEPDPANLEAGRQNFALNARTGRFHHASVGRVSTPPRPFPCESDGILRHVPAVSVDDLVETEGIARIEVLLSDIQGAELEMLAGSHRTVERGALRFLFLSTHHHQISGDPLTHERCLEAVRDLGGSVLLEHTVAESFSGDGLIVASFDPADHDLPAIEVSRNRASGNLFPLAECDLATAYAENDVLRARLEASERERDRLGDVRDDLQRTLDDTGPLILSAQAQLAAARQELDALNSCLTMRVRRRMLAAPGVTRLVQHLRRRQV